MDKSSDPPAFPFEWTRGDMCQIYEPGLTKREYFSALAMQGLVCNANFPGDENNITRCSIKIADALIAELEKSNG